MPFPIRRPSLLLTLALAGTAHATDGYFQHGYGVKAHGAGGVGIALPQDGLAAATNPAGTAFLDNRLDLGLTLFTPDRGAEITAPNPTAGSYDGSGRKNFLIPEIGYIRHLSPALTGSLAIYGNGGMNTRYTDGVPLFGRGEAGVNLEQLFITPAAAWKINDQHALGLAINFAYQRFEAKGLQNFDNAFVSTAPGYVTNNGTAHSSGWGVRLGWTGRITPDLTLGATWSSKINTGNFEAYKGLFAEGGGFDIPENYGIGAAYRLTPALTVAGDLERIRYGGVPSIALPLANLANGLGTARGAGFGWQDVTVYKLGALYEVQPDLVLRAGYNHSTQPIPAGQTLFNILAPGVVQDHLSLGATWTLAGGELSAAYTHALKKTVSGAQSIPPGFGGGESNIHLSENILGVAWGWKL